MSIEFHKQFLSQEKFEDLIAALAKKYQDKESAVERLRNKVTKMEEETYKDSELQRLKEENEELKKQLSRSFVIYDDENNAINEWIKEHGKKHSLYAGAVGGLFNYIFTPTSIGSVGKIVCSHCGEEFQFKDIN